MNVNVWNYETQDFIPHVDYKGDDRVRVDYFGDLSDLAVFETLPQPDGSFVVIGNTPLDWIIDLT